MASIVVPKAKKMLEGRKNGLTSFKEAFSNNNKPVIWFHCASLGEFELSRPIIELYRKEYSQSIKILVTFYSPSGYEVRKDYTWADLVTYLPFDKQATIKKLVTIVNPSIVFFAKYDFWIHLIQSLNEHKIPMVAFSCTFNKNQIYFKKSFNFYLNALKKIDHFFLTDKQSETLLQKYGLLQVSTIGDTRFDKVIATVQNQGNYDMIENFKDDCLLFIAGSVWPEDIDALMPLFNDIKFEAKIIIAPHEINEKEIVKLSKRFKRTPLRYSQATKACLPCHDVLIIDNVGLLASLYRYAEIAFVGGAFKQGLHNILEPAAFGIPVVFGPKIDKNPEAIELISVNGGFSINNSSELHDLYYNQLIDQEKRAGFGKSCADYVWNNKGASQKVFDYSKSIIVNQLNKNK